MGETGVVLRNKDIGTRIRIFGPGSGDRYYVWDNLEKNLCKRIFGAGSEFSNRDPDFGTMFGRIRQRN